MKAYDIIKRRKKIKIKNESSVSELLFTCQSDYDEDSKYVWILCQEARGVHAHVSSAELLNVPSNQLVKGCAPCSGHT